MDIRPIKSEADYEATLREIRGLLDAEPGTPEADRLEVLSTLVEAYEAKHHPIPLPDPIEAIEYHMESRGLMRRDLEPYIGHRGRVSEILNRKRRLTLPMIRRLSEGFGIPAEILVQPYELEMAGEVSEGQVISRTVSFRWARAHPSPCEWTVGEVATFTARVVQEHQQREQENQTSDSAQRFPFVFGRPGA